MDKVSFIIPNSHKLTNDISIHSEVSPNLFLFYFDENELYNSIYLLYNYACIELRSDLQKAFKTFIICKQLINDDTEHDVKYEIYINLALLVSKIEKDNINDVFKYYEEASNIFPDRTEPYYYLSIYCNKIGQFEKAYNLIKKALTFNYNTSKHTYPNTQFTAYGKYLYDELSVSCYFLHKYDECKILLEQIINDSDFAHSKTRLTNNLFIINNKLNNSSYHECQFESENH